MTSEFRIEPLAEGDIGAVIELAGLIWRHHFPGIISTEQVEYMLARRYTPALIRAHMQSADAWWDKAALDGRIMGFVQYERCERAMKLAQLYVHQDYQRRGYGARMLAHVEDEARRRGLSAVRLKVNKRNLKAIAAYRKNGYEVAGTELADIGGGHVMDDYVMQKQL